MKTLIILEGIPSSGKTTVGSWLELALKVNHRVRVFTEAETLMDMVDDLRVESADERMRSLLHQFQAVDADVVIAERFHFTHSARTEQELVDIAAIETALAKEFETHIFLLTLDHDQIGPRVQDSWNRRGTWLGKPGTLQEKVVYYSAQQERLKYFAAESSIPVELINTSAKDWQTITKIIILELSHSSGKPRGLLNSETPEVSAAE